MIVIDIAQAFELAETLQLEVGEEKAIVDSAITLLGRKIAKRYGIRCFRAEVQGPAFAGACITFTASHDGQECPPALLELDDKGQQL